MESPADYLDSPMDGDDVAYPCKGCGDVRSLKQRSLRFVVILTVIHRFSRKAKHSNLVSELSDDPLIAAVLWVSEIPSLLCLSSL